MLYAIIWIITLRLEFKCRLFGTLRLFHLHRQVDVSRIQFYEDGTDRVFRNVGI